MDRYIIEGGKKLQGEVSVSGSKNAALPIIAATILNKGITKLYNVPKIEDTKIMFQILRELGAKIKVDKKKVLIDTRNINSFKISEELMHKLRSSVIIVGALVGRYKQAIFSYPGGCEKNNYYISNKFYKKLLKKIVNYGIINILKLHKPMN